MMSNPAGKDTGKPGGCKWTCSDPIDPWQYATDCARVHKITRAHPGDAGFIYCPFCGGKLNIDDSVRDNHQPATPQGHWLNRLTKLREIADEANAPPEAI